MARAFAIVLAIGIVAGFYYIVLWPIQKLDRCYAVSVERGVAFVDCAGHRAIQELPSKDGNPLEHVIFTIHGSQLLYWSRIDSALGVVDRPGAKPRWYTVDRHGRGLHHAVRRISTDGRFVVMDIGHRGSEEPVLSLDLRNGKWKRMEGVLQARIDPSGTGQIAMRTAQRGFMIGEIRGDGGTHAISRVARVWDWDYDFGARNLYVLESIGSSITIVGDNGRVRRASLPATWNGLSVFWQGELGELWVGGYGAISAILRAPVFSGAGTYLGALHVSGPTFYLQSIDCRSIYLPKAKG